MPRNCLGVVLVALLWCCSPLHGAEKPEVEKELAVLEERVRELEALVKALQAKVEAKSVTEEQEGAAMVASTAAPSPQQAASQLAVKPAASSSSNTMTVSWNDGVRIETEDKAFQFRIGGRIHNDWAFFDGEENFPTVGPLLVDGTEFRRARLYIQGTVHDRVEYKAQYDFADSLGAGFKDVYLGVTGLPILGSLRFGQQKEPFSLEEITSSNHLNLMERSAASAFTPSRNTGILFQNGVLNDRLTYSAGIFRGSTGRGLARGNEGYNLTGRITGLPWYEDGGRKLLHLGFAYSRNNPLLGAVVYAARPEAHLAPPLVGVALSAESADLVNMEAALVAGSFAIQSEYNHSFVNSASNGDPHFQGFYVEGSYFLTGENLRYSRSSGAFSRVSPSGNFLEKGSNGYGAWQVAARYSFLDLNDGPVNGGRMDNLALGLNWYLNPNTRFMWNYVFSDVEDTGHAQALQTRFQFDF